MTDEEKSSAKPRPAPPLLTWPTAMRLAFEEAGYRLKSSAGLIRLGGWAVVREGRGKGKGKSRRRRK